MLKIALLCLAVPLMGAQPYDWTPVMEQINYYLGNSAFPGGVLRVANATHTIYTSTFGSLTHPTAPAITTPPFRNSTIFDVASLTKVTATLTCVMHIYEQGKLGIDDLVTKFIPEYGNGKQNTTVRNLLLHNSGLLPDYPGALPGSKAEVMRFIYNCPLSYPIGTKFIYSDLSFITLGEIVERISKKQLETYAKELMMEMEMPESSFLPDPAIWYRIAPTEYSRARKYLIRGEVHDPTAYLFGGVAGHAGFFSTGEDLQTYMQIHLSGGKLPSGKRIYNQSTVKTFLTRQDGLPYNNRRALGWDTVPIQQYPPCGTLFSLNSFGHTGFTGTMIWADRDKNLIVSILANRVHPTAQSSLMGQARSQIVDAVVKVLKLA